ncbi:hypothetical protein [Pseudidiomarina homiensis]|nr:hypothetical protein [Pseudidiomarina homiensis]
MLPTTLALVIVLDSAANVGLGGRRKRKHAYVAGGRAALGVV